MNHSITLETIIHRQESQLVSCELGDEYVMMDVESGNYISLNKIGYAIWQFVEKPVAVRDLVNYLIDKYEVKENECLADTIIYLQGLEQQSLIAVN